MLTITTVWVDSVDDNSSIFFLSFPENGLDINAENRLWYFRDNLHEM